MIKMKPSDIPFDALLFLIPLLHLLVSPYTKVEESFTLQATHDIMVYGVPFSTSAGQDLASTYDHFAFPGAVPRTFLGSLALAGISKPFISLVGFRYAQIVVRGALGALNAGCLVVFRRALARAFGDGASRCWVVLLVSQFHITYYLSRTLPNMFAFGLTTLSSALLLPQADPNKATTSRKLAIDLLIFAGIIFRSEIAILLIATSVYLLATGQITPQDLVLNGVSSAIAAVAVTVPLDSFFWQKPLWPELWGFYFNAVQGSSSDWGVSPWHYYFASALPRLFLNPLVLPLLVLALAHPGTARQARRLVVPSVLFVAIYSLQPHKETRFIFYVVPSLTAAAALGLNFVFNRWSKSVVYKVGSVVLAGSILASFVGSTTMLFMSSLNYPGGDALEQLHAITRSDNATSVSVHADVLTCMTGLTLLGQNFAGLPLALAKSHHADGEPLPLPPHVIKSAAPILLFDKTEDDIRLEWPSFWKSFDYVLVEDPKVVLGGKWDEVGVVYGLDGIEIIKPGSAEPIDLEAAHKESADAPVVLGRGAAVKSFKDFVMRYTGGAWAGPRMSPRIHILKQKDA